MYPEFIEWRDKIMKYVYASHWNFLLNCVNYVEMSHLLR